MISPNFKFIRGLEKSPKFHKIFSIISSKDLKLNFVLGIALYCGLFHHPVMIRTYHYYKCSGCRIILPLTNMILQQTLPVALCHHALWLCTCTFNPLSIYAHYSTQHMHKCNHSFKEYLLSRTLALFHGKQVQKFIIDAIVNVW